MSLPPAERQIGTKCECTAPNSYHPSRGLSGDVHVYRAGAETLVTPYRFQNLRSMDEQRDQNDLTGPFKVTVPFWLMILILWA
jgi:hypothetical protein